MQNESLVWYFVSNLSPGSFARAYFVRWKLRVHVQVLAMRASLKSGSANLDFCHLAANRRQLFSEPPYITRAMRSTSRWNTSSVLPIMPTLLTAWRAASAETP